MTKRLKLLCGLFLETEFDSDEVVLQSASRSTLVISTVVKPWCSSMLSYFLGIDDDIHIRMPGFHEEWIDRYLDYDFCHLFRMNRNTFHKIVLLIGGLFDYSQYRGGAHQPITIEKSLQIALWYLNKGCALETVGDRFNVAVKTVHVVVTKILDALNKIVHIVVKWPTLQECVKIEADFKQISGFGGITGAMDGCHFKAKVPIKQHDSYQDRHFQHSISMQAICLKNLVFTNISAGFPGSLHDARILRESSIFKDIEEKGSQKYFYNNYHLVADSAYPCKEWIMKPYRTTANMTRMQKNFNTSLSKARVFIEHAFGVLKGRWRILQNINTYTVKRATKIIIVCCVLHNLTIKNGDTHADTFDLDCDEIMEYNAPLVAEDEDLGLQKRDQIAVELMN